MKPHLLRELNEKAATMARAMDETYAKNESLSAQTYANAIRANAAEKGAWKAHDNAYAYIGKCARIFWYCALIGLANILLVSLALYIMLAH